MRIMHLTYASDAGGLSAYIHDLAVATRALGHEVVVAGDRGVAHEQFLASGLEWVEVPFKSGPLGVISAAHRLRGWVAERGAVDLLHSHYRRPTLTGRLLQSRRVPPLLYTLHLSHMPLGSGLRRRLSDFGDHTHVPSSEALAWARDEAGVPVERLSLIPHGVAAEKWPVTTAEMRGAARASLGVSQQAVVGVYVGRLDQDHPKNVHWLAEVAARWQGEAPLKILVVGDGPDEERVRGVIAERGVGDRVELLGHRAPLPAYQAGDLLLLPSGREGFSLVCAEAMCTGLPVLRTRTSGTADLIVEGKTGESTDIEQEAFVAAAVRLLGDRARLESMRAGAAAHIRARFTFERQVGETMGLYERLVRAVRG